jgi:hypothetical protein
MNLKLLIPCLAVLCLLLVPSSTSGIGEWDYEYEIANFGTITMFKQPDGNWSTAQDILDANESITYVACYNQTTVDWDVLTRSDGEDFGLEYGRGYYIATQGTVVANIDLMEVSLSVEYNFTGMDFRGNPTDFDLLASEFTYDRRCDNILYVAQWNDTAQDYDIYFPNMEVGRNVDFFIPAFSGLWICPENSSQNVTVAIYIG